MPVVDRTEAPQRCARSKPRTREHVILHGKRDFADVITVRVFMGRLSRWAHHIHKGPSGRVPGGSEPEEM